MEAHLKRLAAVLLPCLASACTDPVTRPDDSCRNERARVEEAKSANRRAASWNTAATERDAHSQEARDSWAAVEAAAVERRKAQEALDACLSR